MLRRDYFSFILFYHLCNSFASKKICAKQLTLVRKRTIIQLDIATEKIAIVETEELVRRLTLCINRIDGKYYDMARESRAGENEVAMLYALMDGKAHSQKSICAEWLIPKTTVNTIKRRLLDEGYIEVTAVDKREKMIALTESGMQYATKTLAAMKDAEYYAMTRTLQRFDPTFIDALEVFSYYMSEYGEKQDDSQ